MLFNVILSCYKYDCLFLLFRKAGYDDEDEKYDRSSFVVERFFRGNFSLANNSFTSPVTQPDESENLLVQLKQQVRHGLYETL